MENENQDKLTQKMEQAEQAEHVSDVSTEQTNTKTGKEGSHMLTRLWLGFCAVLAIILLWLLAAGYSPYNDTPTTIPEVETSVYQSLLNSPNIQKTTYQEFFEDVEDKESGVYFLGYEGCPWCEDALPVAIDVAKERDIKINYINTKGLKNDTSNHNQMKEILSDCLDPEDGKLYYPLLVGLKDGEVVDYFIGTSEGYDPNARDMNEAEINQLMKDYKEVFDNAEN